MRDTIRNSILTQVSGTSNMELALQLGQFPIRHVSFGDEEITARSMSGEAMYAKYPFEVTVKVRGTSSTVAGDLDRQVDSVASTQFNLANLAVNYEGMGAAEYETEATYKVGSRVVQFVAHGLPL